MAPVPLNIAPLLRPWRVAGITHLLLDETTIARFRSRRQAAESALPRPEGPRPSPVPRTDAPQPGSRPPERVPTPVPTPQPIDSTPSCSAVPLLEPEAWPTYWQQLLQRTPSAPALLWTYSSLSRDLGGAADAAHRNFLRHILGDMKLPKGSHAFWPLNTYPYGPEESEHTVQATFFLSGIKHLNPHTVILMTGKAPTELGLPHLRLLVPAIVQGKRFVVTPHVDTLIQDSGRYSQLMTFLRALLSGR